MHLPQLLGKTNAGKPAMFSLTRASDNRATLSCATGTAEKTAAGTACQRHSMVWFFERQCPHLCPGQATSYSCKITTTPFSHPRLMGQTRPLLWPCLCTMVEPIHVLFNTSLHHCESLESLVDTESPFLVWQ